jgi:hypothetical protein
MEPDVEFFAISLPPGKTVACTNGGGDGDDDDDLEDGVSLVHITQFALGPAPAPGRHTIMAVRSDGAEFAVGTLEAGRVDQFSADLMWSALSNGNGNGGADGGGYGAVAFRHTGGSAVHLTGYKTVSSLLDYAAPSEEEEEEDEEGVGLPGRGLVRLGWPDEESDELDASDDEGTDETEETEDEEEEESSLPSESEGEEAPRAVRLKPGRRPGEPAGEELSLSSESGGEDEDEGWESEEEESDDDEGLDAEERAAARALGGGGGSSSSGWSEEEEEEEESEEEAAGRGGGKRGRPAVLPPAKKAKAAAPPAGPASPPTPSVPGARGGGGSGGGSAAAQYAAALAAHLAKNGPTRLANLGSAVPRPPAAPKLTKVLAAAGDRFAVDSQGIVSLQAK